LCPWRLCGFIIVPIRLRLCRVVSYRVLISSIGHLTLGNRKSRLPQALTDETEQASDQPSGECPTDPSGEYWRWCPRCGHELHNEKCKLRCPRCHYFMSCSDF